ncbi:hypothetical protein EON80_31095 [bacterium]|nr:MAG: hypothetical protein EON80_31095 [bacterium]
MGGYTPRELARNDVGAVSLFATFDSDELAFTPFMLGVTHYFITINEERGSTVVGVWIGGKGKLALGLLPVAFKAQPKAQPLPEVETGAVLVKNHDDTMALLPRPTMPRFSPRNRNQGASYFEVSITP